ncbi:MauE/DoxX family redox-associated membrane protein [Flavobacterium agrisoli]|uniref:Methylamine utilisation protein MauE domain-containing protein n=1 Tax=Flavobacterium agrisoli TaxID=2793066 RepID=A0A934PJX4_9FLAO|nr:MauE/DoxX family redox-associated membrane protein [Flavobacterium agrisoli]MBK0368254.1 hypothetical protein [Flavobacterium agrisoli]
MNKYFQNNNKIIHLIRFLFILLFVYAAVNKIIAMETFTVQLAQSPLLSAFAGWVSWFVPLIEILIAVMLIFPKTRMVGLYGALGLMTMFTAYIFVVLHFSSFVPCSCGGILEKMSWNVHLVFNLFFVLLALMGLFYNPPRKSKVKPNIQSWNKLKYAFVLMILSMGLIVVMFLSSEKIIHKKNPFIRRYIKQTIKLINKIDLHYNSYYFAGSTADKIFLGNLTDPFEIISIDTLKNRSKHSIAFTDTGEPFRKIFVKIKAPYFYLLDGSVPVIYRGKMSDWTISGKLENIPHFTTAVPVDSSSFVLRNNDGAGSQHQLGFYNENKTLRIKYFPILLQKQIDGIFDTDGMLLYNEYRKEMVYVYYYRNGFVQASTEGKFKRGTTIDTITHAKIKVTEINNHTQRRLSAPPYIVNALTATQKNLLFIHSKVPGRYEDPKMWANASVIDVYDIEKEIYLLSFPIFTDNGTKIKQLYLTDTYLYVLSGKNLYVYVIKGQLKENLEKNNNITGR